jgi:PAS domain S-box-containing protein
MTVLNKAEHYLDQALDAVEQDEERRNIILDAMPVPVYLTDSEGKLTYWNSASEEFAGRRPERSKDRWCVTWKLTTPNDDALPHDRCPMAIAIREKRAIRGQIAIALLPDKSRKAFMPFPTPLFDEQGALVGALNMLIDVSDQQSEALAAQADRCRRLAAAISDRYTTEILRCMAEGYERNAQALRVNAA